MQIVKFLKPCGAYGVGETAGFDAEQAETLVARGFAEPFDLGADPGATKIEQPSGEAGQDATKIEAPAGGADGDATKTEEPAGKPARGARGSK